MLTLLIVLIVIACLLLLLVVLVQNPKGGGLSSAFGGSGTQMLGGVKRSGDFLDKATWGLALSVFVLVLAVNLFNGGTTTTNENQSEITDQVQSIDPGSLNINQGEDLNAQPGDEPAMPEAIEE